MNHHIVALLVLFIGVLLLVISGTSFMTALVSGFAMIVSLALIVFGCILVLVA